MKPIQKRRREGWDRFRKEGWGEIHKRRGEGWDGYRR